MPRTVFTKRFAPHSEGRKLQQQINAWEDDIEQLKAEILVLDIGGHQVRVLNYDNEVVDVPVIDAAMNKFVTMGMQSMVDSIQFKLQTLEYKYVELTT